MSITTEIQNMNEFQNEAFSSDEEMFRNIDMDRLAEIVFPAYNETRLTSIPNFTAREGSTPIINRETTAYHQTYRSGNITVPRAVNRTVAPVDFDSICTSQALISAGIRNEYIRAYLKILAHAYWYYSRWIDYKLDNNINAKKAFIAETIRFVNDGLEGNSTQLHNTARAGMITIPVYTISRKFFAWHFRCYHDQIYSKIRELNLNDNPNKYCLYMFSLPYAVQLGPRSEGRPIRIVSKISFMNRCGWLINSSSCEGGLGFQCDREGTRTARGNLKNSTPEFKSMRSMAGTTLKAHRAIAYMLKSVERERMPELYEQLKARKHGTNITSLNDLRFCIQHYFEGRYNVNDISDW